jgi:hypothetical protein
MFEIEEIILGKVGGVSERFPNFFTKIGNDVLVVV